MLQRVGDERVEKEREFLWCWRHGRWEEKEYLDEMWEKGSWCDVGEIDW